MSNSASNSTQLVAERALANVSNAFELVNLVVKRARQLNRGAQPLVLDDLNLEKPAMTALREIAIGEVVVRNANVTGVARDKCSEGDKRAAA